MSRSLAFCDGFTLSTPKDNGLVLLDSLRPILDDLGCTLSNEGCYRTPTGAAFLYGSRGGVSWLEAKGQFVTSLRSLGLLNEFLSVASQSPHRVTRCDLTVDEFVTSPAQSIQRAYALAKSGSLSLTRKVLKSSQISSVFAPTLYDNTGSDTGTVYLGNRSAEVRARIYDKTQERASVGECIGLTVRHELTVTGKMGVTLRDVSLPQSCFYHFYPEALLNRPDGVPAWSPHAEGFQLEKSPPRLPTQRLKRKVEHSLDLAEMIDLANSCGPEGIRLLHRLIDEKASRQYRDISKTTH